MKSTRPQRSGRAVRSDTKQRSTKAAKKSAPRAVPSEQTALPVDSLAVVDAALPTEMNVAEELTASETAGPESTATFADISQPTAAAESDEVPAEQVQADQSLQLPASCTLRDAASLRTTLIPHVSSEHVVRIDAGAVERIDTAALQVLMSFVRDRSRAAQRTEWLGLNETFMEAVDLLGMREHLSISTQAGPAA